MSTVKVQLADWLDAVQKIPRESVDLLYADPPFNTGKVQATPPRSTIAGRAVRTQYRDSWPTTEAYIAWLSERLEATLPTLKPSANILVHCDYRASHHIRILLERLLGAHCFVNHIIWSYGLGGSSPRTFARKHDDILFYCLDPDRYYFEPPLIPATSRRLAGKTKKATDVLDIAALNNMAAERTGYPTQKPLQLLKLLVNACAPPDGTVLDPCCGSGTTLVAASELGRHAIGFDLNPAAIEVARERTTRSVRMEKTLASRKD